MSIFSLEDYIAGSNTKKAKPITEEPEIENTPTPKIVMNDYSSPEPVALPAPSFSAPVAPVSTDYNMPIMKPKETPSLPMPSFDIPKVDTTGLTLPKSLYEEPLALKSAPQGGAGGEVSTTPVQESLVKPQQETSPTAADKTFYAPVKLKDDTLELPPEWTQADVDKVAQLAKEHGVTKEQMFGIIYHETAGRMSTKIKNRQGATGLIQFTPETAADLQLAKKQREAVALARADAAERGLPKDAEEASVAVARKQNPLYWQLSKKDKERVRSIAQKAVENMTVSEQLDLKSDYLKQRTKGAKGLDNVYSAIFAGNTKETYIPVGSKAYEANKFLDKDNKGGITREEWLAPVLAKSAAIKNIKLGRDALKASTPDKASGIIEQRTIPEGQKPTPDEQRRIIEEAKDIASLAKPGVSRSEIEEAVQRAPIQITNPGTPEDDYLKKEDAYGLHWKHNGNELIEVTSGIPRSAAVGVAAHEIIHALPQYGSAHSKKPEEITSSDANWMLLGGKPAIVDAARKEGGRILDAQYDRDMYMAKIADTENLMGKYPKMPRWFAEWLATDSEVTQKPSESQDMNLMRKTSGPSKERWWETVFKEKSKKKP